MALSSAKSKEIPQRVPLLSVIIVSWNSSSVLPRCLQSLEGLDRLPGKLETIVIDNSSTDGTIRYLKQVESSMSSIGLRVLYNKANIGLSRATEQAYHESSGEWTLLCNPDTVFNNSFKDMLSFAVEHIQPAVFCPELEHASNAFVFKGTRFPTVARVFFTFSVIGKWCDARLSRRWISKDYYYHWLVPTRPFLIDHAGASFLLLRRTAIERIGQIFCPEFSVWWNDNDLTMRLEGAGIPRILLPWVRISHHFGQSQESLPKPHFQVLFFQGMSRYATKWKMHPLAVKLLFLMDAILAVPLVWIIQRRKSRDWRLPNLILLSASQAKGVLAG